MAAGAVFVTFSVFYWWLDRSGGFYLRPSYPSPSMLWIVLPTVEGLAYASLIAWYDTSFKPSVHGVSAFVGRIGELSYSIYLLHVFFVFRAAAFIHTRVRAIDSFPMALGWAVLFFFLMLIPAALSYRYVESPFLRMRRRYVVDPVASTEARPTSRPGKAAAF